MEVKHKDHVITYREDSNDWFSPEIGVKSSLSAAKKAVDDLLRKGRRADIVALMIKEPYCTQPYIQEVKIGAMVEPRRHEKSISEAWITYMRDKYNEREKVNLSTLYSPEYRPRLEEYLKLREAASAAERAAEDCKKKLDGLTAEAIQAMKGR